MVRKEEGLHDDISINSESTTESSDSYSYLLRDVENPNNHINEEWEAIERTLYQESGKHVSDPVLLKECKLWRETFPHFRVRGTAIRVEQEEKAVVQSTKSVEALDKNQLALTRLNEKRDKIKKTVVSQIVERLINKLNINKENSLVSEKIMERDSNTGANTKSSGTQSEKESYFERGKRGDNKEKMNKFQTDEPASAFGNGIVQRDAISDLFDDFECNFSTDFLKTGNKTSLWSGYPCNEKSSQGTEFTSNLAKNEEILRSGNITFKIAEKSTKIQTKREKPSDSLSGIIKPFEMTKKIDKKYESMLESILENKGFIASDSKKSNKQEIISCRESVESNPGKQGRDYTSLSKNKQFPKLNFTNNWMNRADQHAHEAYGNFFPGNLSGSLRNVRNIEKQSKFQSCRSAKNINQCDEKFLEEIKREICDYTTSLRDYEKEINVRPHFHNRYKQNIRSQKSSSCGDLAKKNPKSYSRPLKSGLEKGKSEITMRHGAKNKIGKNTGNQNIQLPPIETSIICTEIIGRPKIASKPLPKKYM